MTYRWFPRSSVHDKVLWRCRHAAGSDPLHRKWGRGLLEGPTLISVENGFHRKLVQRAHGTESVLGYGFRPSHTDHAGVHELEMMTSNGRRVELHGKVRIYVILAGCWNFEKISQAAREKWALPQLREELPCIVSFST